VDPSDGSVWVSDNNLDVPASDFVAKLDQDGNELVRVTDVGMPIVLAVDSPDGAVWVGGHETLLKLRPDGKELARIGGVGDILDIAVSPPVPVECTDLNNDGKVSGRDVEIVARAMPSDPDSRRWNPEADLDNDQDVDRDDFRIVIRALVDPDCR
jgi:DNA-binding beta-propeller fold protein YncE